MASSGLDLPEVQRRLAGAQGRGYWRSLEELAGTEAFQEFLQREFPSRASEWTNPVTRRRFLQIMGASLALAGLAGRSQAPRPKNLPHRRQPPGDGPGQTPLYSPPPAPSRHPARVP